MHPIEMQGEDWYLLWGIAPEPQRPSYARMANGRPADA
jgi:hypothetical protein